MSAQFSFSETGDKEKTNKEWIKIPKKNKRPEKKPFTLPFRDTNEDQAHGWTLER